jgi:hypothetical protein
MNEIRHSLHDNNELDRNFEGDLWLWLKDQPQDVWLLLVRVLNWDQADKLFVRMLKHPHCDLSVVYFLFWSSDPSYYVRDPEQFHSNDVLRLTIKNLDRGFYTSSQLFCDPVNVIGAVHSYIKELKSGGSGSVPFSVPQALIGPINGRKARVPTHWSKDQWQKINGLLVNYDCVLPRSEEDYWQNQVLGGNVRAGETLRKQNKLKLTAGDGTVLQKLERVYGKREDYLNAIKTYHQSSFVLGQTKSVLNPDLKQRYIGYGFFAFALLVMLAYIVGYFLR